MEVMTTENAYVVNAVVIKIIREPSAQMIILNTDVHQKMAKFVTTMGNA